MVKRNSALFLFGLLLFLGVFGASVWLQSPILLYIASAIPMFVVPFLPDFRTNQSLRPGMADVDIVKVEGSGTPESELLVVTFAPGKVHWNRKYLFVPLESLNTVAGVRTSEHTAAVTVLRHDLKFDVKRNRIGIYLPNLKERLLGLPYTTNEVNRFVLRMEDVRDSIMPESMQSLSGKMNMQA